mmetsp:Transcript_23890/g.71353  ORF Transcript_23890/g.71353 Transcript_23890/m.71353 type:complete len:230 (-) Transcript_23890:7-696(-)
MVLHGVRLRPHVGGAHVGFDVLQSYEHGVDQCSLRCHGADNLAEVIGRILVLGIRVFGSRSLPRSIAGSGQLNVALEKARDPVHGVGMHRLCHSSAVAGDGCQLHQARQAAHHLRQHGATSLKESIQCLHYRTAHVQLQVMSPIRLLDVAKQVATTKSFGLVRGQQHMLAQRIAQVSTQHALDEEVAICSEPFCLAGGHRGRKWVPSHTSAPHDAKYLTCKVLNQNGFA